MLCIYVRLEHMYIHGSGRTNIWDDVDQWQIDLVLKSVVDRWYVASENIP